MKPRRESSKRTISPSGGLELLQMVLDPDIGWCASEVVRPLGGGGGVVRTHIGWREERTIPYKRVETSPQWTRFKTLRGSLVGKVQRGQYLRVVGLSCYTWYQTQTLGGVPARSLGP